MLSSVVDLCGFDADGSLLMPIVQMNCDESGKWNNTDWVVLGGLVAAPITWNHFNRDWRLKLKMHGLSYIHMSEAMYAKSDEFKRFRGRETECDAILLDCATAIVGGITPIVASIKMPKNPRMRAGKQFDAFEGAMKLAHGQLLDDESLSLICDEEDKHSAMTMYDLWRKYRTRSKENRQKASVVT